MRYAGAASDLRYIGIIDALWERHPWDCNGAYTMDNGSNLGSFALAALIALVAA